MFLSLLLLVQLLLHTRDQFSDDAILSSYCADIRYDEIMATVTAACIHQQQWVLIMQ